MTVDEKLAIKNLQAIQYIIIHSTDKGGKIVIMKRNKKQPSDSTFTKKQMNLIYKNKVKNIKLRNEIMNIKANN